MTAAVIALGIALGAATVAIVVLAHYLRDSLRSERAAFAAEVMATREQIAAEIDRDAFKAKAMKAAAEAVEADRRREAAERAANRARQELVNRVSNEMVAASPSDVLNVVDWLLAQPLPSMPTGNPGPPASASGGQDGSPAV